jgi:hypothetical protein
MTYLRLAVWLLVLFAIGCSSSGEPESAPVKSPGQGTSTDEGRPLTREELNYMREKERELYSGPSRKLNPSSPQEDLKAEFSKTALGRALEKKD